ncbi:MAG: trigger factor, partial [bacterium]
VKNQVGEMKIYEEALEIAIPKTYTEAIKLKKLETIGQPQIKVEKLAPGNPLIYTATVALLPIIKLADYKKTKAIKKEIVVGLKEIEDILENLRKMRAKEKLVEREVKNGDRVAVDFEMFLAGVPAENGQHKDYPLVIGENRLVPGFEDQLISLKAGEKKEFSLKFPAEHFDKNLAGREVDFKTEIKAVYGRELPELDDEFAKNLGQFDNLIALKKQIGDNLEQEKKMKEEQRWEGEILDKIVKASEFGIIPEILIDNECHKMVHEFESTIERQGLNFGDYLKSVSKTKEQLEKGFAIPAEERVKAALITREIARLENIEVRDDEIDKEIENILQYYSSNSEIEDNVRSDGYRDYLRNVLATRKVVELLKKIIIQ